jgi:carboxypeptidase Taq
MYEQGLDRALDHTLLSDEASLGVHESQSRMWEKLSAAVAASGPSGYHT